VTSTGLRDRSVTLRGAKFYRDGADQTRVLFVNYLDSATRDGPRPATEKDAAEQPDAFGRFLAEDEAAREVGPPDKKSGQPTKLERPPLAPLWKWELPEGVDPPPRHVGPYELARNEAFERMQAKG
jgi:hypothetical protein